MLLSVSAFGQVTQVVTSGSPKILARQPNIQAYSLFIVPVYPDTATALSTTGVDSLGMVIQIRSTGNWYRRDTSAGTHKWTLFGAGGGGGTDSAVLNGLWLLKTVSGTNIIINVDSGAAALYFPRRKDSTVSFATPTQLATKQPQLNGTGFVKATGTTISYDNSVYITVDSALVNQYGLLQTVVGTAKFWRADTATLFTALRATLNYMSNNGNATGFQAGAFLSRPSAVNCKCFYAAPDSGTLWYDNGAWIQIAGVSDTVFLFHDGTPGNIWHTYAIGGTFHDKPDSTDSEISIATANDSVRYYHLVANSIANAKLATMGANTIKGSVAGGTPGDLTQAQVTAMLNIFTTSLQGEVPASGGGTTNFLRADGTWALPPGGGGSDSAVLADGTTGTKKTVSGTNIIIGADTIKLATRFGLNKNVPGSDTSWKRLYCIPNINTTLGTGNGSPMPWFPLTTGGNHGMAIDMDSCLFVNSSGHLLIGYETMKAVANSNMQSDEVTYPISWSVIGNADNIELIGNIIRTGLGFMLKGQNTNAWLVANSQLYTYAINGNTGAGPDSVPVAGPTDVKFDLLDGTSAYLGPTISGLTAQYHGANGYTLERFSTAPHQFNFRLKDAYGGIVTGYPQATDSIWVFDGAAHWEQLDLRQFLTSSNWLFASGLANAWFGADVQVFPDSLRIGHVNKSQAVASGTAGQINLTWQHVTSGNDAAGYYIDRSANPNFSGGVTNLVVGGAGTTFTDTGLTTGTTYYYRFRASRVANVYGGWVLRSAVAP